MNFESLLSEYDREIGMMGDYSFGAHFLLEQVTFTLTHEKPEITVEGDRLTPLIYIPISRDLLDDGQHCSDLSFKIVPILFNIGINEKQSIADDMARNDPNYKVSLIGKEEIRLSKLFFFF